jgi:DNA polymerase-1
MSADLLAAIKSNFSALRQAAKTTGFMVMYGGGPGRYAEVNNTSLNEGRRVIKEFFRGYSGLDKHRKDIINYCRRHGHIRTLLRSYIHIPDITHPDPKFRGAAERKPLNYEIQGSAAELLKMSMVLVYRDDRLREWGVKMPMQIHDELLFFIPKDVKKWAGPIIEDYVSHPYRYFGMKDLEVDTPAAIGFGTNWLEAKKDGDLAEKRLADKAKSSKRKVFVLRRAV